MILPKIDYHSHILPCIDDGADSIEKSLMMLEKAKKYGIQAIYATPHCYMHKTNVHMFCEMRKCAYEKIKDMNTNIPILMGAEVLLFPGLENLPDLEKFCLEESNSLLIEMPLSESLITMLVASDFLQEVITRATAKRRTALPSSARQRV